MNIKNINFGFVFQLVAILSLIIIYIFQWGVMITTSSLRTGTDFMAFYSAGRVAQGYGVENAYDISLQQKIQEEVLGFSLVEGQVLLYNHLPYLIPILSFIVSENYIISFLIWAILMLSIYIIASTVLVNEIQPDNKTSLIGVILFFPFFQSLLLGQDTAILFLGTVFWFVGLRQKKDWLIAFGLALTSVRPHLCLLFVIPFVFYDFRLAWKSILAIGLLAIFSILLIGWNGTLDFIGILQISADGTWHGMNEASMFNLLGLIARSFPFLDSNFIRILGWVGYALAILISSLYWKRKVKSLEWLVGFTVLLTLFFSPHLHYHDLALLIIPIVMILARYKDSTNIILGISFVLLILKPLYYVAPYILYICLFWLQTKGSSSSNQTL
jgi:hypothetical protein